MSRPFRVIALISAFNEGDVISCVIEHLVENGVDAYLLDHRSTDDTVEQARRWLGRGLLEIESFPAADDPRYGRAAECYDWTAILLRKEELARTLDADWFLHHDADEIRESPWDGVTLRDAIQHVDRLDYNCIDFRIFEFPPVDDGFRQGMNLKTYFTQWQEANASDQRQLKCWKAREAISLVHCGGHDVDFKGKRVFPVSFLLRHYPIRGQNHGRRKIFEERKPRFNPAERAKAWHVQYDAIQEQSHSFLVDPEHLQPFDLSRIRLETVLHNRIARAQKDADAQAITSLREQLRTVQDQVVVLKESISSRDLAYEGHYRRQEAEATILKEELGAVRATLAQREIEQRSQVTELTAKVTELELARAAIESRGAELVSQLAALSEELAGTAAVQEVERSGAAAFQRSIQDLRQQAEQAGQRIADLEADLIRTRDELGTVYSGIL